MPISYLSECPDQYVLEEIFGSSADENALSDDILAFNTVDEYGVKLLFSISTIPSYIQAKLFIGEVEYAQFLEEGAIAVYPMRNAHRTGIVAKFKHTSADGYLEVTVKPRISVAWSVLEE